MPTEPLDLVTTHQNADLDGLASMVALHLLVGPLELALPAGMDQDTKRFWTDQSAALPPIVNQPQLLRRLREAPLRRLVVADTAHARPPGGNRGLRAALCGGGGLRYAPTHR